MMSKKIIAMLTALVMVLGCTGALAENTKHERVYVVAGADGTVTSITDSIRLENMDGLDELADRTMLNGIQNVGGNEAFTLEGETLTWKADGKNVIYQGTSDTGRGRDLRVRPERKDRRSGPDRNLPDGGTGTRTGAFRTATAGRRHFGPESGKRGCAYGSRTVRSGGLGCAEHG